MKIDKGSFINDFIDKNLRQYSIPVYQRNYEWSAEQCEKLFEDIIQAHKLDRYHFTGSVVYSLLKTENKIDYYIIIDGQQRLTTIYILLQKNNYTNGAMLAELRHYATQYSTFINGDHNLGESANKALEGLHKLKQTTVYLFLFHVFDDYEAERINEIELTKVLQLLLNYSIRSRL